MATSSKFAESPPEITALGRIVDAQHAVGATTSGDESGFSLEIDRALHTRYKSRGEPDSFQPTYIKWRDG